MIPQKDNPNVNIALVVILLITIFAYLPVFHNGLLMWGDGDDKHYIINNNLIKDFSWGGIKAIFSDFNWDIYCPLTFLIHAVLYKIGGTNPVVFHLTSLIFHLVNTALVFWLIKLLCDRWEVAAISALLFGIHPMGVESVAWASAGTNLHCTAFFLGSLIVYLYYLQQKQKRFLFISLLLFILSSLSKAVAVVLPVVLLLIDYYKGRKITVNVLLEKIPFLIISLGIGMLSFLLKKEYTVMGDLTVFTLPRRAIFAAYGFITYIFKLLLPINLSAIYPYPRINGIAYAPIYFYLCVYAALAIGTYIIYMYHISRKIIFGLGFFIVNIFLLLQLIPVGFSIIQDRYSYIPYIGLFYLAGEGLVYLWNKKSKSRTFGIALLSIAALFYSVQTYSRCGVWKNDEIFWQDVIDKTKTFEVVYYNRGNIYMDEKRYDEAIKDFNKTIELRPDFMNAYINLGIVYINEKRYDEALKNLNKAIEINPGNSSSYLNRGNIYLHEKRNSEAIRDYNKAIELNPGYAIAYYNRGILESQSGNKDAACLDLNKAADLGYRPAAGAFFRLCK